MSDKTLEQSQMEEIIALRTELAAAKAENARLAAAWHTIRVASGAIDGPYVSQEKIALLLKQNVPISAIRELLWPVVELLERADRELKCILHDQPLFLSMREQAARLRAAMG